MRDETARSTGFSWRAGETRGSGARSRNWLYNHNPLYPVSAALVLHGVHASMQAGEGGFSALGLLGVLSAYALVLVIAALLVVRLARVWEDARTIICVFVLMVLASSVVFDDVVMTHPELGRLLVGGALLVAMGTSELLLRGVGVRLGLLYRLPYHLFLGVFFAWPMLLARLIEDFDGGNRTGVVLALAAFPVAGALVLASLIPALRRGRAYVEDNGTPWGFPAFPLPVFVIMTLALAARSYLLCRSLYPSAAGTTPWQSFMLTPIVLAAGVVLIECVRDRNPDQRAALHAWGLALGLIALGLAYPRSPGSRAERELLEELVGTVGAPSCLAWISVALFFVHGWRRRMPGAEIGLAMALVFGAWVGTGAISSQTLPARLHLGPLGILAALQIALLARRPSTARALALLGCVLLIGVSLRPPAGSQVTVTVVVCHALVVGVLVIGATFRDEFARVLRQVGLIGVLGLVLAGALVPAGAPNPLSVWGRVAYLVTLLLAFEFYRRWTGVVFSGWSFQLAAVVAGSRLAYDLVWWLADRELPRGAISILLGQAVLVAALCVSFEKGRRHRHGVSTSRRRSPVAARLRG